MKWTRQRCHVALRTLLTAAFDPLMGNLSWLAWRRAKAASRELAQKRGPERLGLGRADVHAENLAPAMAVDPDRDDTATETMRPFWRTFTQAASIHR
jgi:hypothetical protein